MLSQKPRQFSDASKNRERIPRRAGLRALVYTANDPAEAHRLMALGIDGIITDAVDRFSPGDTVLD